MRLYLNKIIIIFLCIILGFFIAIQFKNIQTGYNFAGLDTISDLENAIKKEEEELANINNLITFNKSKLEEYEKVIREGGSIKNILEKESKEIEETSGFTDVEGPGVILKVSDSERKLYEWEDPNNLIVHDIDVLNIINDLKVAGAEALSINGQRIMSTSEIQCAGATITINNHTYGQPFIIKAIGNPDTLNAALRSPGSYAYTLKEVYDLGIEIEVDDYVRIAGYNSTVDWKYLMPKEGE